MVRHATPADADAIAGAHTAAWRQAYRGAFTDAYLDSDEHERQRRERWRKRLRDGPPPEGDALNELFAVEIDGRVVGFGHAGREDADEPSDRGEIYGFYLHPAAWGSGAPDQLMDACLESLRRRFDRAVLWVVRDNPRARRFYERRGWSAGTGAEVVEIEWTVPPLADVPDHPPVTEIQYRIDL